MFPLRPALLLCCLVLVAPAGADAGKRKGKPVARPGDRAVLYVAPYGDDASAGTRARPLRTVERALRLATGGETVRLAPGEYPFFRDIGPNGSWVTVEGPADGKPASIAGGEVAGATWLRFQHVRFTQRLTLRGHPKFGQDRPAHHITVVDSEFTNTVPLTDLCATIRQGAHDIAFVRNHLHHCTNGITGPGDGYRDPALRRRPHAIAIRDNRMEHFRGDGIQFAHWDDVTIAGNRIAHMADPQRKEHNDGIQITGNASRVRVVGNVIADSSMLFFAQDAFGPNHDLVVRGNLMVGSKAYGLQILATENLQVIGNTIWKTGHGGILLRRGLSGVRMPGAIIANNIADGFVTAGGVSAAYLDRNLLSRSTTVPPRPNELIGVDPRFRDAAAGDYRLAPDSPALDGGDPAWPSLSGDLTPDMGARLRLSDAGNDAWTSGGPPARATSRARSSAR